jgi:hypothetical protein
MHQLSSTSVLDDSKDYVTNESDGHKRQKLSKLFLLTAHHLFCESKERLILLEAKA